MTKKEFDVFLSSDQDEFFKIRKTLSKVVCSIQFLTCTPLENRGAETTNPVEASIKAVRNSDIYVGIFGSEYSETTMKEYREAIRLGRPCLTYVKKLEKRDEKLSRFIDEDLADEVTYSSFRRTADLTKQLKTDLKRLISETLSIGFEEMAKKKKEFAVIEKEEKTKLESAANEDPLERARFAIEQNNYIESLVRTSIALESGLRKALEAKKLNVERKSFVELIQMASRERLLDLNEENKLREISHLRNIAVHQGDTPNKETTLWIIESAKSLIAQLSLRGNIPDNLETVSFPLKLPKEIEDYIIRRKPQKYNEEVFRKLIQGIERIPGPKKKIIKDKTILFKTRKPFVSVELRKERIILHLTLPEAPRENGVEYLRKVYTNLMHCHLVVRNLNQIERAIKICNKAYYASSA